MQLDSVVYQSIRKQVADEISMMYNKTYRIGSKNKIHFGCVNNRINLLRIANMKSLMLMKRAIDCEQSEQDHLLRCFVNKY